MSLTESAAPVRESAFVVLVLERNLENVAVELGEPLGVLGDQKDPREPLNAG